MEIKRSFQEIKTKYLLEPELLDVYVEGAEDVHFYSHHIKQLNCGLLFIDISIVDFHGEDLDSVGFEQNNRDRIIYLIKTFQELNIGEKVYGIVDKDILPFTRGLPNYPNLLFTDYSCLEMYWFCHENITKVQEMSFRTITAELITKVMKELLPLSAFAIYEKRKGLSIKKVAINNYVRCSDSVTIDWTSYVRNTLISGGFSTLYDDAIQEITDLKDHVFLGRDSKECINGHTLLEVLSIVIQKKEGKKKDYCNPGLLYKMSMETDFLREQPLFKRLVNLRENSFLLRKHRVRSNLVSASILTETRHMTRNKRVQFVDSPFFGF